MNTTAKYAEHIGQFIDAISRPRHAAPRIVERTFEDVDSQIPGLCMIVQARVTAFDGDPPTAKLVGDVHFWVGDHHIGSCPRHLIDSRRRAEWEGEIETAERNREGWT